MARYNRSTAALALVVIAFLVFPAGMTVVLADIVGDGAGWGVLGVNYQKWADKAFYAGDPLDFVYDPQWANVVVAGSYEAFEKCSTEGNFGIYDTGFETLVLTTPGTYYFFSEGDIGCADVKFYAVAQ